MTTAGNFLLPDATLIIECIVFLIVLAVVSRAALPRLRSLTAQRQQQLDDAEHTISRAKTTRETAVRDAHLITTAAHRQARDILARARAQHDELVAEGRRQGREEYEWMTRRTQREAERSATRPPAESLDDRPSVVGATAHPRS